MDTDGNKVTWVVIIVAAVAIMGGLFIKFVPNIDSQMQAYAQTVIGDFRGINSGKSSGSDEDDNLPFTYQYDTNAKTATITGYNLKSGDDLPADLKIPAYKDHNGVKYTVTSIGNSAFYQKSAPAQGVSVILPDTIKTIGGSAFGNDNLTSINLPTGLTSIGHWAFAGTKLTSVNLPDSLTLISDYAFYNTNLTSVDLPESLVSIGNSAFSSTKLTNVTIPSTLKTIGERAFSWNEELTSVDMSNATGLTSISDNAFFNNRKLASLKLPSNGKLSSIGDESFRDTALTKVEIPASVTKIGYLAFGWIGEGASVVIHSPEGAIAYVTDDKGTTSTTPAPDTFSDNFNRPLTPIYVTD